MQHATLRPLAPVPLRPPLQRTTAAQRIKKPPRSPLPIGSIDRQRGARRLTPTISALAVVAAAVAVVLAVVRLPCVPQKRHLDRSKGQFYRPLRSGETPVFAVAVVCSPTTSTTRHFDRSGSQSHRELRSGETAFQPKQLTSPRLPLSFSSSYPRTTGAPSIALLRWVGMYTLPSQFLH